MFFGSHAMGIIQFDAALAALLLCACVCVCVPTTTINSEIDMTKVYGLHIAEKWKRHTYAMSA